MIEESNNHLNIANETYSQHFKTATIIGYTMIIAGIQVIFHAFIPEILKKSASDKIKKLYESVADSS